MYSVFVLLVRVCVVCLRFFMLCSRHFCLLFLSVDYLCYLCHALLCDVRFCFLCSFICVIAR